MLGVFTKNTRLIRRSVMPKWKSKKVHPHGVWGSEVNLNSCNFARKGKVNKLLKLLEKEGFDETIR